jgi:hypothetical protein
MKIPIHGAGVARIELVPRVAGMIHHDLPCPPISRSGYSLWMELGGVAWSGQRKTRQRRHGRR